MQSWIRKSLSTECVLSTLYQSAVLPLMTEMKLQWGDAAFIYYRTLTRDSICITSNILFIQKQMFLMFGPTPVRVVLHTLKCSVCVTVTDNLRSSDLKWCNARWQVLLWHVRTAGNDMRLHCEWSEPNCVATARENQTEASHWKKPDSVKKYLGEVCEHFRKRSFLFSFDFFSSKFIKVYQ